MLLLCLGLPLAALAQGQGGPSTAQSALTLHEQGQYQAAATQGLSVLLSEPWNHALRFIVADSLQKTGRINEAVAQYEAMEGTAMSASAADRLRALRQPQGAAAATGAVAVAANASETGRSPSVQEIYDLNAAENYATVGSRGLALFAREKPDDALRLMVANSLAWSGRLSEAAAQYQLLQQGPLASQASIGLANVYRWQGRDERAAPIYRTVLSGDPANADALDGLALAERELKPRTTITVGGSRDSADMERRSAGVAHRWRDQSGNNLFEVETSGVNDQMGAAQADQRDLTVRYQAKHIALQPSLELSAQNTPARTAFGSLRLKLGEGQHFLELGRVNWGRMVSNPLALAANLNAKHAGLQGAETFSYGSLSGRINYYDISDGNKILTTALQFTPSWRPLGSHFKPFVGMETRDPRFNTPKYWSPADGFGSAYAGLLGEWNGVDWSFFASGLRGVRLYGEAGTNWSLSAGGRHWLGKERDMALGINLWSMSSVRDNSAYKAHAISMSLEKFWK